MSKNLHAASHQWSSRPADERFENLQAMYDSCYYWYQGSRTATVQLNTLTAQPLDGEIVLRGSSGSTALMNHWSFGQLARTIKAPTDYLRALPVDLACANLNYGLNAQGTDGASTKLLLHSNGNLTCRAFTGENYGRIWNYEIVARLMHLQQLGWRTPPARPAFANQPGTRPATEADILPNQGDFGLSVKVGDLIAPAGLYASDHDMFAFLVNETARIKDGTGPGLARGVFISNSEVGAATFRITAFLYRHVCGNHIVWGAENVKEVSFRHTKNAPGRFEIALEAELKTHLNKSATEDEARISECKRFILGGTKDEVIDRLFGMKSIGLTRKVLEDAYSYAEMESDFERTTDPRSSWGFAQGLTRLSARSLYTDERTKLDRTAGKVLEMAF